MGIAAASPNIRTRIRAPKRGPVQLGFVASLPGNTEWTMDTGSINHWVEVDAGNSQQRLAARYIDVNNSVYLANFSTGNTTYSSTVHINAVDTASLPSTGTSLGGVTVQAGDRWRCEAEGAIHRYKLFRAGAIIFTSPDFSTGLAPATLISKLASGSGVSNNVTYGTL